MERITYHFLMNSNQTLESLKTNKIFPVNKIPDEKLRAERMHDYAERARQLRISTDENDDVAAEAYFKNRYDKLYRDVLGLEYFGHYGIYTTPIPIFFLKNDVDAAIKIEISKLIPSKLSVIHAGNNRMLLTEENFDKFSKPYLDNFEMVKKIWESETTLKFKKLPQIVIFEDFVSFTKNDILLRGEF